MTGNKRTKMLCEICHEREATVHLTLCASAECPVTRRDFCEQCLPFGSMSNEQQSAALRKLFEIPPDVPLAGSGDSHDPDNPATTS